MRRFKSPGHAQRFLAAYGPIASHSRPRRHRLPAAAYRQVRNACCATWRAVTGVSPLAWAAPPSWLRPAPVSSWVAYRLLKLTVPVAEFHTYIANNATAIPNYGERHRSGEAINSAIAESTVNQVISKRMVKRQQMRWTPEGAHLLRQVRTCALNDDLRASFARWYPALDPPVDRQRPAA